MFATLTSPRYAPHWTPNEHATADSLPPVPDRASPPLDTQRHDRRVRPVRQIHRHRTRPAIPVLDAAPKRARAHQSSSIKAPGIGLWKQPPSPLPSPQPRVQHTVPAPVPAALRRRDRQVWGRSDTGAPSGRHVPQLPGRAARATVRHGVRQGRLVPAPTERPHTPGGYVELGGVAGGRDAVFPSGSRRPVAGGRPGPGVAGPRVGQRDREDFALKRSW